MLSLRRQWLTIRGAEEILKIHGDDDEVENDDSTQEPLVLELWPFWPVYAGKEVRQWDRWCWELELGVYIGRYGKGYAKTLELKIGGKDYDFTCEPRYGYAFGMEPWKP